MNFEVINEKVISVILSILDVEGKNDITKENLKKYEDMNELGINSIVFIKIVVALEEEFDIEFDDDALDNNKFGSVQKLSLYVQELIIKKDI